jgi:hypothetical protein
VKTISIFFTLLAGAAHGQECPKTTVFKGQAREQAAAFDKLLQDNKGRLLPNKKVDAFAAKNGLPFRVQGSGLADRIEQKAFDGTSITGFLKRLDRKEDLAPVYEAADVKADKPLKTWLLPVNHGYPMTIEGDELTFNQPMTPFCAEPAGLETGVRLAVKPDGSFHAVTLNAAESLKEVTDCPAKKLIADQAKAACAGVKDRKTKKLRLLVFQKN